ncbi:MAG: M28 family metallopeptidase [Candidatus Thermoplasmatota archaeon]|nr:M28 family metallopeptidase [Candidatus Thermoplasmatota archaeon]
MKNRLKYISIIVCSSLFLTINVSALSEKQILPVNNSSFDDIDIVEMINSVNESKVLYYYQNLMKFGVRYTGTSNCTMAGDWIYNEFEQIGLNVEFHEWNFEKYKSKNVVATIPGKDFSSNAIFILCAHYDTFKISPGANDDGSGIVAVLCIAEILSKYSFNHTIKFIAFSGEEVGTYGSFTYARDAYNRNENIVAVLNLDIIGYADTSEGGKILRFFHEEPSTWIADFAKTISSKYIDINDMNIENLPNYPGADNQAFVDYGYDGVWIAQHDPNQVGHSKNDTLEHINLTYQIKATKLMLAILTELAIKPINIQVILRTPLKGMGYFNDNPFIELPFAKYYWQRLRGITIAFGRPTAKAEVICKEKVRYVIFTIDDTFIFWDDTPPYEWKIQGKFYPLIGRHTLKVYAYSETGEMHIDQMDIIFLTLSYQYGKW